MSTTVNLPEELISPLREGARLSHLSESDFVAVALAQSLARVLKEPDLEDCAARATGEGWRKFLTSTGNQPPQPGDEMIN